MLKDVHSFNFLVGQEGVDYRYEGFKVTTKGQSDDFLTNVTSGTRASSWGDETSSYGFLSFFGRGEYNYDDRYYADFQYVQMLRHVWFSGTLATFWSVRTYVESS